MSETHRQYLARVSQLAAVPGLTPPDEPARLQNASDVAPGPLSPEPVQVDPAGSHYREWLAQHGLLPSSATVSPARHRQMMLRQAERLEGRAERKAENAAKHAGSSRDRAVAEDRAARLFEEAYELYARASVDDQPACRICQEATYEPLDYGSHASCVTPRRR